MVGETIRRKRVVIGISLTLIVILGAISLFYANGLETEEKEYKEISIPFILSEEAYRRGLLEGLVTINPEKENVPLKTGKAQEIKLNLTYKGNENAPDSIVVKGTKDRVSVKVPYRPIENGEVPENGYVEPSSYINYNNRGILLKKGENTQVSIMIEIPKNLPLEELKGAGKSYLPVPIDYIVKESALRSKIGITKKGKLRVLL